MTTLTPRLTIGSPASPQWIWQGTGAGALRGAAAALVTSGATPAASGRLGLGTRMERATTNLLPNPTFGVNTSGWIPGGSNALTRVTNPPAPEGLPPGVTTAMRITYADSVSLTYTSGSVPTAGTYALSAYLYIPSDWDGGQIEVRGDWGFAGAYSINAAWADLALRDQWQRISHVVSVDADDLSGTPLLRSVSAPTAGRSIYLAALQWEAHAFTTEYCDGSLGDGYSWSGTAHSSTSQRAAGLATVEGAPLDPVRGALACWVRPGWAAAAAVARTIWHRTATPGEALRLAVPVMGGWILESTAGGVTTSVTVGASHAAHEDVLLVASWTPGRITLAAGNAQAAAARGTVPALPRIAPIAFGRRADIEAEWADAVIGPAMATDAPASAGLVTTLRRGRPFA